MLESGHGTLVRLDLKSGAKNQVARMPGFTRGMDFAGPLAFIGLSKVRETATFSDFPLLEELEERICGGLRGEPGNRGCHRVCAL